MQRFLVSTFWASLVSALGFFAFAAGARAFGAMVAGYLFLWLAICTAIALCWRDRDGLFGLWKVLIGRRPCAKHGDTGLLIDVKGLRVAAVFYLKRDVLVLLRGGTGTCSLPGASEKSQWPDGAELFLTWQCPGKTAAVRAGARLLSWEASCASLTLVGASCSSTVLEQDRAHRVLLPPLSSAGGDRSAPTRPR